jgi:hypothetical protein
MEKWFLPVCLLLFKKGFTGFDPRFYLHAFFLYLFSIFGG